MSVSIPIPFSGASGLPHSQVSLTYQGGDISSLIQPNLIRLSYHDRISYQADSLEFTIADADGAFRNKFTFQAGNSLTFGLAGLNWSYPGESLAQNYGQFSITRVGPNFSASGSTVDIRCSAVPIGSSFRLEMKFQRWQDSNLKDICNHIADDNSMTLNYLSSTNPKIASIEQFDESDMVFVSRVAQMVGMSVKIRNNTIIVFSRKEFEAKAPKGFIVFPPGGNELTFGPAVSYGVNGAGGIVSAGVSDYLDGIFKDCRVAIRSPYSGQTTTGTFTDPNNPPVGATLQKRQNIYPSSYPASQAAPNQYYDGNPQQKETADEIAYNELRRRAEKRHQLQVTIPFCLKIESADVWTMQSIGPDFDGNWLAIAVEQDIDGDSGSQTRASFEKCLSW